MPRFCKAQNVRSGVNAKLLYGIDLRSGGPNIQRTAGQSVQLGVDVAIDVWMQQNVDIVVSTNWQFTICCTH